MMDAPQPPPDDETRNIIDRLANFVARNGQDFENMTKQKQHDNPKFQFLFGGEYYGYYTYRVTTEQAILKHQSMRQQQQFQQQQLQMSQPQMQPQQGIIGNPAFGTAQQSGSPHSRFSMPQPNPNPGPLMPQLGQRFERPPFQQGNFPQMNFERPPAAGGNFQNFDRCPGPQQHTPNWEPPPLMQGFDRNQPNNFERFPSHPLRFDSPTRPEFHHSSAGHPMMGQGPPRMRPPFENIPSSSPSRFDRPMGDFERPMGPGGIERNTSVYVNPNFDPQKLQLPQQPQIQTPLLSSVDIEALVTQRKGMEEQIQQSEKNLAGQQQVLLTQQQAQVEEALRKVQDTEIVELAAELNVDMEEFASLLQLVMDTCTKESIANGKAWIFLNSSTKRHYELITLYLLRRVTDPGSTFLQRLHVIYLVNDTLHHCVRKGAEDMQLALEKMVIPMFCFAKVTEAENEQSTAKLNKLQTLWESKPNYITKAAAEKLKNFTQAWSEYKNELVAKYALVVTQIANTVQKTFEGYQNQHLVFVQHINQSIKQLDQKIEDARIQQQKQKIQEEEMRLQQERIQQENLRIQDEIRKKQEEMRLQQQEQMMRTGQQPPGQHMQGMAGMQGMGGMMHPGQQNFQGHLLSTGYATPPGMINDSTNSGIPDMSRPPPLFNNPPPPVMVPEIPRLPYFELPAGLMVPLVRPEDDSYRPIDPSLIRLPPPCPPSERLIQAIEAFYGPPSHDNPRDSEGWERLGLYEYYKTKNLARKQKEDDIREGRRQKSRSPTPIRREMSPSGRSPPPRRRYRSKSPSPSPKRDRRRSRSRSPRRPRDRDRKRRSRSRSRSPPRRSPTPPSFGTVGFGMEKSLDETNKGHQLLKKMGWGGSGLGLNEQGIEAPIKGGELRDRVDQYKGVGINLHDPFESYRKTKGQAFVDRMRARGDERP